MFFLSVGVFFLPVIEWCQLGTAANAKDKNYNCDLYPSTIPYRRVCECVSVSPSSGLATGRTVVQPCLFRWQMLRRENNSPNCDHKKIESSCGMIGNSSPVFVTYDFDRPPAWNNGKPSVQYWNWELNFLYGWFRLDDSSLGNCRERY